MRGGFLFFNWPIGTTRKLYIVTTMAKEFMPINPDILKWARERSGLSEADANKKFPKFQAWEIGELSPTYSQLEQLSDTLKLPIAAFFFPKRPTLPDIEQTFRSLPSAELSKLSGKVRLMLRKAKAMQLNLSDLYSGKNPARQKIVQTLEFRGRVPIAKIAEEVRGFLGVTLEKQFSWKDAEEALSEWRNALQKSGISVFKDAFRDTEISGFCLYDPEFPIIYVNNTTTKTRQIFTLAHELGHLLFRSSGIDWINSRYAASIPGADKDIEVACNQFAVELLVPDQVFSNLVNKQSADVSKAVELATKFHVSREVIYRKFLDRGWINGQQYETQTKIWNAQGKKKPPPGGDPYWTKLSYLGRDYVSAVLNSYHQNRIDEIRASDFLETKPKHLAKLEEYYLRGAA
jgi:Zn-dependent peptidase ImmA (M78 family)/transcriptional regulator with XRE-family HTH domain